MQIKGLLKKSNEGLMSGNGTLGILLFGEEELYVSFDRINLWDKRIPKVCENPNFNFQYLSDSLNKNYKEAYRLFDESYNAPYPTRINAGIIKTGIKTNNTDIGEIDYFHGIVKYNAKDNYVKAYVDANTNIIVLEYKKLINPKIELPTYFYKSVNDGGLGYLAPNVESKDGFTIIKQPMYDDEVYSVVSYIKNNKQYFSVITNDHVDLVKKKILDYVENEEEYFEKHLASFDKYFSKSNIETPDEEINQEFNLGRYYFYCSSRKKFPCTLQSVWTDYKDKLPPWKNDIHNDINMQMTYEAYLKLGNYSEGKVLLDYLEKLMPKFRKNARTFLKTEGIYIPGVMNIEGFPIGGWPQYSMNPVCQIWLIKAFDEYYRYQEDNQYLKEVVYPLFKEVESSIFELLHLNEKGFYELSFHSSPEYFENDPKSIFKDQTNFELTMLRYLYSTLIDYTIILNQDNRHFRYVYERLHDYYRDENNHLMVAPSQPFNMSHRHFSHMLMYKNMRLINPFEYKEIISEDIKHLENQGYSKWVGFSFVENAGLHAYIGNGEEAYKNLKIYTKAFIHPNGFHMNNDYKGLGYSDMDCYVFTLETNFGFMTSLEDMMIQNYGKKVIIFPAIPKFFRESKTSFEKLRIHGNHQVSATIKNNVLSFKILMSKEDTFEIFNNFKNNPSIIIDGAETNFQSNIGEFIILHANKTIEFKEQ